MYWADGPDDFYKRSHYKDLLPSRPRVVDPANPANNVWESGFCPPGHSSVFIRMIETIDLSQSKTYVGALFIFPALFLCACS